jgi:hypothetical protein
LIFRKLYKLGLDNILRRCVLDHERHDILWECHRGIAGGHVGGKEMTHKVMQEGLLWETLFKDEKTYTRSCELLLQPVRDLQTFEKWEVDFIRPINRISKHSKARYIITAINYLTHWVEATTV